MFFTEHNATPFTELSAMSFTEHSTASFIDDWHKNTLWTNLTDYQNQYYLLLNTVQHLSLMTGIETLSDLTSQTTKTNTAFYWILCNVFHWWLAQKYILIIFHKLPTSTLPFIIHSAASFIDERHKSVFPKLAKPPLPTLTNTSMHHCWVTANK